LAADTVQHKLLSTTAPAESLLFQDHDAHAAELESLGAAAPKGNGTAVAAEEGGRKRSSRCAAVWQ
jgi:hypothetical protein